MRPHCYRPAAARDRGWLGRAWPGLPALAVPDAPRAGGPGVLAHIQRATARALALPAWAHCQLPGGLWPEPREGPLLPSAPATGPTRPLSSCPGAPTPTLLSPGLPHMLLGVSQARRTLWSPRCQEHSRGPAQGRPRTQCPCAPPPSPGPWACWVGRGTRALGGGGGPGTVESTCAGRRRKGDSSRSRRPGVLGRTRTHTRTRAQVTRCPPCIFKGKPQCRPLRLLPGSHPQDQKHAGTRNESFTWR